MKVGDPFCVWIRVRVRTFILPTSLCCHTALWPTYNTSPHTMPRPAYTPSLRLQAQPCAAPASEDVDLSLFSTILLVLVMLLCAAFFIMTLSYLLANEYDVGKRRLHRQPRCIADISRSDLSPLRRSACPRLGCQTEHARLRRHMLRQLAAHSVQTVTVRISVYSFCRIVTEAASYLLEQNRKIVL